SRPAHLAEVAAGLSRLEVNSGTFSQERRPYRPISSNGDKVAGKPPEPVAQEKSRAPRVQRPGPDQGRRALRLRLRRREPGRPDRVAARQRGRPRPELQLVRRRRADREGARAGQPRERPAAALATAARLKSTDVRQTRRPNGRSPGRVPPPPRGGEERVALHRQVLPRGPDAGAGLLPRPPAARQDAAARPVEHAPAPRLV